MSSAGPLLTVNAGYSQNCKSNVVTPATGQQINFFSGRAVNQSGGAIDVAIGKSLATPSWKFGTLTAASTPNYTDFTAAIQGGGGVNIFTTTTNGGYLVGASKQFNLLGLNISTGQSGSPVYTYQYYNGTAYTTLTTYSIPATYATGTQLVVFPAPQDWVPGTTTAVGGDSSQYNIIVNATTAGGTIVVASSAWVVQFLEFGPQIANNSALSFNVLDSVTPIILSGGEGILPYFSGTANAKNSLRVLYSVIS